MAPFLLLAGACSQEDMTGGGGLGNPDNDGLTEVTLDVSLPTAGVNSRAGDVPHISSASKVDMLIYAVYDVTNDNDIKQVDFYQVNFDDPIKAGQGQNFNKIKKFENINQPIKIPAGQTYVGFGAKSKHRIVFKINPDKKYQVVFWAQDSECEAYNTEDLTNILVSYEGAKNNDESRDAFTAVSPEYTGNTRVMQEVVLRRAVAQINIGTTGADYANLIYAPNMLPKNLTINESKITVTGVADQFNALTGWATASTEDATATTKDIVATFEWAPLPAWTFIEEDKIPSFREYDASDWDENHGNNPFVQLQDEEFLHIDYFKERNLLAPDGEGYKIEYPTINADGLYVTDTFKYLSMCYVLVKGDVNKKTQDPYSSTVKVSYDLRQNKGEGDTPVRLTERELTNVPVQGNFRTNILGGLFAGNEREADPTSIFNFYQLPMIINEIFDNHENERYNSATLKVKREYPDNDGLQVKIVDPEEIFSTLDENEKEVEEFQRTIFFPTDIVTLEFKFYKRYSFNLDTSVDGEYYDVESNEEGNFTVVTLTLYDYARAGTFNVRIGDPINQDLSD